MNVDEFLNYESSSSKLAKEKNRSTDEDSQQDLRILATAEHMNEEENTNPEDARE